MNGTTQKLQIAVLLACYNRKEKTLNFLNSLVEQYDKDKHHIDIYILDDGSTDGTPDAIKMHWPFINIVIGTGSLFWSGSMRTIWKHAMEQKSYDLFLLFNDDVVLFDNAFENLITGYQQLNEDGVILVGSTIDKKTNLASYGGYKTHRENHCKHAYVYPDADQYLPCHFANANVIMIDAATVKKIGIFPDSYTHGVADYDYTYTAYKSGIKVLIAPGYYGYCENDHGPNWASGKKTLKERIKYLYSPKGLAYKEYLFYIKKNFPSDYYSEIVKLWMKTFFPIIWDKFKKEE